MFKENDGRFIQKVCGSLLYILYLYFLDIYNDRVKNDTLFWDATNSLVRKGDNGKYFLIIN